jgi:hypothetical protein
MGKDPKICIGATRRNLQARPEILKKYRNVKSTDQNENFPKKKLFSTLKVLRSQKFAWGLPDEIFPKTRIGAIRRNLQV